MFSGIMYHIGKLKFLLNENSSTILTAVGVAGTVSTSVLTARSTFKASRVIAHEEVERSSFDFDQNLIINDILDQRVRLSTTDKVKLVWALYLPPVATGAITITSIILAHKIDAKRVAALTAALGVTERSYQEYKDKIHEKFGDREAGKVRDEIATDRVKKNPPPTSDLIMMGDGDVLCLDSYTGRYFKSNMEAIKRAENGINHQILHHEDCSLSDFLDDLGVSATTATDEVGWNAGSSMVEINVTTAMTDDQRPCLVLEYEPLPFQRYSKFHAS